MNNLFFIVSSLGYSIPVSEDVFDTFMDYLNVCYPDFYCRQDKEFSNFYVSGNLVAYYFCKE